MEINTNTSETKLINRAKNGDHAAFEALLSPLLPIIYHYLLPCLHSPEDIKDLIQESMLAVWLSLERYQGSSSFQTWCLSIVRHKLFDYYRSSRKITSVSLEEQEDKCIDENVLEDQAETRMLAEEIYAVLEENEREIVFWIFQARLSYQETAQITGLPIGTIKSRMARIKTRMLKRFQTDDI